jgi:hypothetical protein
MSNKKFQKRYTVSRKATLGMILSGGMLLLLMAACTTTRTSTAPPTPPWSAWRWRGTPSPFPFKNIAVLLATATPDPRTTPTPTATLTPILTPTSSLVSASESLNPQASPTPIVYEIVASYMRQQLFGTIKMTTNSPDETGVTPVKWWGQNTLLTICVKFNLEVGNTTLPPPANVTFVVYNPDSMQPVLNAIPVTVEDPSILCGLFGKQELSDKPPLNPFEITKDGVFGVGYLQNEQIVPITIVDADWVPMGKAAQATPDGKNKDCGHCHEWPLPH